AVQDSAGNIGTGTVTSNNYAVSDTVPPTVTVAVADTALAAGETSLVTITFSEVVAGFDNADLTVANGTLTAVSSSDGGKTWTATLTPTANLTSTVNQISLNRAGVQDLSGNAGTGVATSNNYAIDTSRPTATIVLADSALSIGETSQVTITFSEAVTGFTNADLTVVNGTLSSLTTSNNVVWTATFTPTNNITDSTNVITLANTGVSDAAGNTGSGTTDSNNYAIDTQRPTASILVADASLTAGETSLVTITFSEAVSGFTNADLTVPNGTLSTVTSSDGGITWTATYTPNNNVNDTTNLISLNNAGVADLAGNAGVGTSNSGNFTIDTVRPSATVVVADSALSAGETSLVTITFSEAVTGFTNADLTVANGTLSAVSSSNGGITWTATLTPSANVTDTSNLITLDASGVANASGNAGTGTINSNNYAIDTLRPTANIVV
ncbi:Ig-like domain-containing protein, partial [Pseudomonas syringae]